MRRSTSLISRTRQRQPSAVAPVYHLCTWIACSCSLRMYDASPSVPIGFFCRPDHRLSPVSAQEHTSTFSVVTQPQSPDHDSREFVRYRVKVMYCEGISSSVCHGGIHSERDMGVVQWGGLLSCFGGILQRRLVFRRQSCCCHAWEVDHRHVSGKRDRNAQKW